MTTTNRPIPSKLIRKFLDEKKMTGDELQIAFEYAQEEYEIAMEGESFQKKNYWRHICNGLQITIQEHEEGLNWE